MYSLAETGRILAAGIIFTGVLLLGGCRRDPGPIRTTSHIRMMDDTLIRYNRGIARTEDQEIRDFTERYGWDMSVTSTGVRYLIYRSGSGRKAEKGLSAAVRFDLKLLTGKHIYSSDSLGLKEFPVGYGETEPGLQEAILLMREGDRAKVIIPSRLGYGLLGDGKRIPPGATLVYDLELVSLKDPKQKK